jgi:hypothetical protein
MKEFVALLYIAFANVLLLAQTRSGEVTAPVTTPLVNRVEQLSKRFPPELIVPIASPGKATLLRSYCVYPALDTKSLSFKPCPTNSRRLRLAPSFENIAPPARPATPPDNIR